MASKSNGGKGHGSVHGGKSPEKGSQQLAKGKHMGKHMKSRGKGVGPEGEEAPQPKDLLETPVLKGKPSLKGKGMSGKSPAALKGKAVDPPSAGKGQDLAADQRESTEHGKSMGKSLMKGKGFMKGKASKGKGKVLEKGAEKPEPPRETTPPSEGNTGLKGKGKDVKGKGSAGKKGKGPVKDNDPPKENLG